MPYTGCTNNLDDRIKRHNAGEVIATRNNLPVEIVTYIVFSDKYKAYEFEKYLKKGSGRAFSKRHLY
jgi:putative endonuclease